VYRAVGAIAILLGVFNLKDYLWYGGGGFKLEVPESWRPKMKGILEAVISIRGAYVVGLIVSLFLLPCALGPYFVASGLLAAIPTEQALGWLIIYNIVFILPMLVITLMVYGGFAAIKNIEQWRQRHIKTLHLFAGVILCGIGCAIVAGVI
jgi:cytochrome c biogenesis protein CcdA